MHRSAWHGLRFLFAALQNRFSVKLYAYLDGIHMGHTGQRPYDAENIGEGLEDLYDLAGTQNLTCQILACNRCASARGYGTWDDGKGVVISTCGIKPFKIRDLNAMVDPFRRNHIILQRIQDPFSSRGKAPVLPLTGQSRTAHRRL